VLDRLEVAARSCEECGGQTAAPTGRHGIDVGDRRMFAVACDYLESTERGPVLVLNVTHAAMGAFVASYSARGFLAALRADAGNGSRVPKVDC
jgi:hypothetical protein